MFLIIGLGNQGFEYTNTRHNVGFTAVDLLSDTYNFTWKRKIKLHSSIASGVLPEYGKLILCKPNTYMNLSGKAANLTTSFYKSKAQNTIVIHDDINIPLGTIRYKFDSSSGGHNGIKSINKSIGSSYHRVKIGIGRPKNINLDVATFVLDKFPQKEQDIILDMLRHLVKTIHLIYINRIQDFKEIHCVPKISIYEKEKNR